MCTQCTSHGQSPSHSILEERSYIHYSRTIDNTQEFYQQEGSYHTNFNLEGFGAVPSSSPSRPRFGTLCVSAGAESEEGTRGAEAGTRGAEAGTMGARIGTVTSATWARDDIRPPPNEYNFQHPPCHIHPANLASSTRPSSAE